MSAALANADLLPLIPTSQTSTDLWDHEWIMYLDLPGCDIRGYLRHHTKLTPIKGAAERTAKLTASQMLDHKLFSDMVTLCIWANGSDLVGKSVVEIGCGPGYLGKQLGFVAKEYVGMDHSKLAVSIARLVSRDNCRYMHLSETDKILGCRERFDTMVGRFFFIHQNFDNALHLMRLAHLILKPTGVVCADFYRGNPAVEQGVVYPAKSPLHPETPSCGFQYSDDDIKELADRTGFKIGPTERHLDMQRQFVRFEKA